MIDEVVLKLLRSFPWSFINFYGEFIAHKKANEYFNLKTCKDEMDAKCRVLERFSASCKVEPYKKEKKNLEYQDFMRRGINMFLGTSFNELDMDQIYANIGNGINRELTIKFIESGYKISVLEEQ